MSSVQDLLPAVEAHFEVEQGAHDDEAIIAKEAPGEHRPEGVSGAQGRKDEVERAFGNAGVAGGRDEGNCGLNRDRGHRRGEIVDFSAERGDDEERNRVKKDLIKEANPHDF